MSSTPAAAPSPPPKFPCPHCSRPFTRANDRDNHILNLHPGTERFPCAQCLRLFVSADSRARHQKGGKCQLAAPMPLPQAVVREIPSNTTVLPPLLPFDAPMTSTDFEVEEKESIAVPVSEAPAVKAPTSVLDKVALTASTNGFAEWLKYHPLQPNEGRTEASTQKQYVESLRVIMSTAELLIQDRVIGDIFAGGFDFRQLVMHESITVAIIDRLRRGQRGKAIGSGMLYKYALVLVDVVRMVKSEISRQRQIYIEDPYDYIKGARAVNELSEVNGKKRKWQETKNLTDIERRQLHLSNDERLKVHSHCLSELRRFVERGGPMPGTKEVGEFRDYVIVALMMSNPLRSEDLYKAERCHVLQPGSPANELQTSWVIRLPPELLKRKKDVKWIVVHESLRAGWELYLNEVLPAVKKVKGHEEHLFFHATGTHITDFGDNIGWITQFVVGRRINPHKTRKTLATSLRNMAGTTEMDMAAFAKTAHHSREFVRLTMSSLLRCWS